VGEERVGEEEGGVVILILVLVVVDHLGDENWG